MNPDGVSQLRCPSCDGADFDYINIDRSGPQGTVEIKDVPTANGTAVEIEPL